MRKLYLLLLYVIASFDTFSQSNFTILQDATQLPGCNCYQLTPDAKDKRGAIFQTRTINLNNSFDYTFHVYLGSNGGTSYSADGIVFVLTTNPNGLGSSGQGLGYGGCPPPGLQPCSFGIEFDTWANNDGCIQDPSDRHTAYEANGNVDHNVAAPVNALAGGGTMADGNWHTVRIVWNVATAVMDDYFDGSLRISQALPALVSTYLCGNPIVNWGWSGATGGGHNDQRVCMGNISTWTAGVDFKSCNPTIQFTDVATGNAGNIASWAWTFGDGGTSTLQNPLHTYAGQGTYNASVIITDVNGCSDTSSHPVIIGPPIVISPTLQDPPCNGGSNGNINTVPSGGFGPGAGLGGYTYEWNNNPLTNNPNLVGVPAGTYTVSVTDGICSTTAQYTLNQPSPVTASVTHTDATCNTNNGTASITITGGTPPYVNIIWNNTFNGANVSGLAPAPYVANFTDVNGCSALLQYSVVVGSLPCGYTLTTASTNVNCFGASTGSVTVTVTHPVNVGVITYTWVNAGTGTNVGNTATVNNLPAGTYTYTYHDNNQTFTGNVRVYQPGAPMVSHLTTVNISCGGRTDGQAVASVDSGGVSPYSYAWNPAQTNNPVASNLGAGAITVTITDANTCTSTATGTISAPPLLNVTTTVVNNACALFNTGSATANPTGGNSPYTYSWSNVSSARQDLSLAPGTYTVTVTDNKTCTATGTATVAQAPALTYQRDSTNIKCFGGATGTITVTMGGGTPPYTYTWNPGTVSGSSPTGLTAGAYFVTASDANSCAISDSIFLKQPASALSAITSHTNVTCFNASNGSVTINVSGGTPTYTYKDSVTNQSNPLPAGVTTLNNLPPGTYAGTIIDANGCTFGVTQTVTSPLAQSLTTTQTNEPCFGASAGSATATFVNATGAVGYLWSNNQATATASNLIAGTYTVTGTDANTCTQTNSVTITQPAAVPLPVAVTNASCFGGNGSVTATPTGGTLPYTYAWSGTNATTATVALPFGNNYTVTASDANQCGETATFSITQPPILTVQVAQTNIKCFGDATGAIALTVGGGVGPYTYTWNPNVSTTPNANALTAGPYSISVKDANLCPLDTIVTLTQPAAPLSAVVVVDSIPCFGQANGSVTLTTSGGTSPYTYVWTPNANSTSNSASPLAPGLYSATITDANSCTVSYSGTIVQPAAALTLNPTQANLTCFGNNTGIAVANAAGGTIPYTYNWSQNVSTTDSALGLAANTYGLTVTDKQLCTATASYVITQPAQLTSTYVPVNVLCNGQSTGSITITPGGGTGTDTYSWSPNTSNTGNSATGIPAGTYRITITDANNCTIVQTATVTQPPVLTDTALPTAVICFGQSNGTITVIGTGGVTPYSYSISSGGAPTTNATGLFNNLTANTYAVVLTDNNACTYNSSVTVTQPPVLTDLLAPVNPTCFHYADGQLVVVAQGGVTPYNYSFSNGTVNTSGIDAGLRVGTYVVTVSDANNCTITDSTILTQPDSVLIEVTPTPAEVKLGNALQLTTTTNQTLSVTYSWKPEFGLSCYDCSDPVFNGIYSQAYTVVATNQNSCIGTSEFIVTVIPNYDIFLPNVFTPNHDGNNDFWQMFGNLSAVKQLDVAVFNRIGEKVFESNDINFKWDGTYKGEPAPQGVYVYWGKFVWLNNHSDNAVKGTITLLR